MSYFVGTSGFSYKEWKGPFYPEKLKNSEMLSYYATKLTAVEINNTFYRMPKKDVVDGWAAQVPDGFRFIIKASRRITHLKRLKETDEQMGYLLANTEGMRGKLGAILFQLPPNFRIDLERLKTFVSLIPEGTPAAVEFRHISWFEDPVFECLRERNIAICHADDEDLDLPFVPTADWGYLRLRKPGYDVRVLKKWIKTVDEAGFGETHIFFKHEDEGAGPNLAMKFQDLVGVSPAS